MLQKHVFADAKVLASEVAGRFRQLAERTIAARGQFSCALTGGSAAKAIYGRIAEEKLDWSRVHIFWGDERMVPRGHADSNYKLAHDTLLSKIAIPAGNLHPMPTEKDGSDGRAAGYLEEMRRVLGPGAVLDLVHLGLGPDGHICSLFAGVAGSAERGDAELVRHVAAPLHVDPKVPRLTLLPFLVVTARTVVLQVTEAKKAEVLARAIKGAEDLVACPAQWVRKASGRAIVVCDSAAAARL